MSHRPYVVWLYVVQRKVVWCNVVRHNVGVSCVLYSRSDGCADVLYSRSDGCVLYSRSDGCADVDVLHVPPLAGLGSQAQL